MPPRISFNLSQLVSAFSYGVLGGFGGGLFFGVFF